MCDGIGRATAVSLRIGLSRDCRNLIGLTLGLLAGYVGGFIDDIIMFITNLFTVIPTFVMLILISFSIGQEQRGAFTIAVVIGFTSWVWTARAVRAQVVSLRNRDHVNLSKLSGHSLVHIILNDILPYILLRDHGAHSSDFPGSFRRQGCRSLGWDLELLKCRRWV
jgi:peptide/nickel transport system permease protein